MIPLDQLKAGDVVVDGEGDLARVRRPFRLIVTRVAVDGAYDRSDPKPGDHVTVTGQVLTGKSTTPRIISVSGWVGEPVAVIEERA